MSTEADLLPFEAYEDVKVRQSEDTTNPTRQRQSSQPHSPGLFFSTDNEEDAGEHSQSHQSPSLIKVETARVDRPGDFPPYEDAGEDINSGLAPEDDAAVQTDTFLNKLGSPNQHHRDDAEAPTEDRDEDEQEYSEDGYPEDAQSRSADEQSETSYNEYLSYGMRAGNEFVPLNPMSRQALEQRYEELHGEVSPQDIDLAMTIMGPAVMDFATTMARRMRNQGQAIILQELEDTYGHFKNQVFPKFIDGMTREALPIAKQRVDEECHEYRDRAFGIINDEARRYKASKKAKIKLGLEKTRMREQEQAIRDVKAYRDTRFAESQAQLDKDEEEAYDELDKEKAASRARKEARLDQDIEKERQRRKAQMMITMKREVQDEKVAERAKMEASLKQEKAERMAKMKSEVAQAKDQMLVDEIVRKEEQLKALASKKNKSLGAAGPEVSPNASVRKDRDVQEDSLEGNTLVDTTPNNKSQASDGNAPRGKLLGAAGLEVSPNASVRKDQDVQEDNLEGNTLVSTIPKNKSQANDGTAPRGKKRSRSPSRAQETKPSDALDNYIAPDNAQSAQKPSEEDSAPSPKRQRMSDISDLSSKEESKTSDTKPFYTRGTESVLGSSNNMQAPENPAMSKGGNHEENSTCSQEATNMKVIESMEATSSTVRHDNNAIEANAEASTNHAGAISANKQTDGAEAPKKRKYTFGKTNILGEAKIS